MNIDDKEAETQETEENDEKKQEKEEKKKKIVAKTCKDSFRFSADKRKRGQSTSSKLNILGVHALLHLIAFVVDVLY